MGDDIGHFVFLCESGNVDADAGRRVLVVNVEFCKRLLITRTGASFEDKVGVCARRVRPVPPRDQPVKNGGAAPIFYVLSDRFRFDLGTDQPIEYAVEFLVRETRRPRGERVLGDLGRFEIVRDEESLFRPPDLVRRRGVADDLGFAGVNLALCRLVPILFVKPFALVLHRLQDLQRKHLRDDGFQF